MTLSLKPFNVKKKMFYKAKFCFKVNAQTTIVKRCLNEISKLKKSTFSKNPGVRFTLKISANQRFGTYV